MVFKVCGVKEITETVTKKFFLFKIKDHMDRSFDEELKIRFKLEDGEWYYLPYFGDGLSNSELVEILKISDQLNKKGGEK